MTYVALSVTLSTVSNEVLFVLSLLLLFSRVHIELSAPNGLIATDDDPVLHNRALSVPCSGRLAHLENYILCI